MLRRRLLSIIPVAVLLAALPITASASAELPPGFFARDVGDGVEAGWLGQVYMTHTHRSLLATRGEVEAWAGNSWRIQQLVTEGMHESTAIEIVAAEGRGGVDYEGTKVIASTRPGMLIMLHAFDGSLRDRITWKMLDRDGRPDFDAARAYYADMRRVTATIGR